MQQFTVPQFIDVEDKIIGPITVRQFIILMISFGIDVLCYKILDFAAFIFATVLVLGSGGILAFLKINGRPFHYFILNFVQTIKKPSLRVWNHIIGKQYLEEKVKHEELVTTKAITQKHLLPYKHKYHAKSRLAELSLIVDTHGTYQGEAQARPSDIHLIDETMDIG
jgi:hypothetical protein